MDDWMETDDERRASFEVVALSSLPDDEVTASSPGTGARRGCRCSYCRADWPAIAEASVALLRAGVDPLDSDAVMRRPEASLLNDGDRIWLHSLFADPIVCGPGDERFTNGRHRAHAMRALGVAHCVVYTKVGER